MIGDWADFAPELGDQPIAKIITARDLYMIDNGRMVIRPIPLTVEILEKNGFNEPPLEMQKRERFVVLCKEYQINYYFNINWFSIYKNAGVNGSDYPVFICSFQERIKYVHELQHALRLCKVDKEIVL